MRHDLQHRMTYYGISKQLFWDVLCLLGSFEIYEMLKMDYELRKQCVANKRELKMS